MCTSPKSTDWHQRFWYRWLAPTCLFSKYYGAEFTEHCQVAKAVTGNIYFCAPYCSCQRGTNKNTNGLIRQYFPKGTDFRNVSGTELRRVVNKLNDRPRRRLGYRTPPQVFLGEYSGALKTTY
ncbi:IS30 family transposase [Halomonas sp. MS1]|nr:MULTISPECIES: IS30 family transposase [unclassified Halomonas]UTD53866.1 IS30 family transposase [Halomonas sp. MS1]